ncbi:hypothetical protein OJF2_31640 [Aquisphaera giovannonii]|uniref:Uncharacterized protein n=1 Tax=Aquisphaera giovannonii TaxID=406548 RepID=A0A5B9W233_9BACT|nr:hypothetical protein [Aquisphaera giovannonii]QEH34623.1 hypothetical protein OJF2_31640 [Aquisphaera giovannonii]
MQDSSYRQVNYRLDRMRDGRFSVRRRRGFRDMLLGHPLCIIGPGEPDIPEHPLTRQELYAVLSDLASRGYSDNLLP